jgi:serine protease Do
MLIHNPIRRQSSLALLSVTIASFAGTSQDVFAQGRDSQTQIQSAAQQNGTTVQQTSNDTQTVDMLDGRSDGESLDLGVLTASCPANAVCVKQVLQHSPADEAGVEAGDYLLSIDGKKVISPNALNTLISSMARDKEVELKVWRQGKEIDCKVHLASKSEELPKCHDAWLGVMLSNETAGGVKIEHIVAGSPASESDLEDGDILVKAGGSDIKDAQTFLQSLEALGPKDSLQLTVRRDSKVHEVKVKLGSFCDAPMAFVRYLHSKHQDTGNHERQEANSSTELMDRALDDMRIRIRELRDEVQSLKEGNPAKPVAEKQDDVSSSPITSDFKFVSQIDVQVAQRNYRQKNSNRGYNPYRNNNFYGQNNQRYSPYYGNGYSTPYGGNNYYYRQNSLPYYYGGNSNNWYGNRPRSGIQVGPNIGVYWY